MCFLVRPAAGRDEPPRMATVLAAGLDRGEGTACGRQNCDEQDAAKSDHDIISDHPVLTRSQQDRPPILSIMTSSGRLRRNYRFHFVIAHDLGAITDSQISNKTLSNL